MHYLLTARTDSGRSMYIRSLLQNLLNALSLLFYLCACYTAVISGSLDFPHYPWDPLSSFFLGFGVVILKKDPTFFDIPVLEMWGLGPLPLNMKMIEVTFCDFPGLGHKRPCRVCLWQRTFQTFPLRTPLTNQVPCCKKPTHKPGLQVILV